MSTSKDELIPLAGPPRSAGDPTREPWTLWLGPGIQAHFTERLASRGGPEGSGRLFPGIEDLAELLKEGLGPGRLVINNSAVPHEDLGILRRFLAKHPCRELVVLARDDERPSEHLLVLPRTRLLPRPLGSELFAYLCSQPDALAPPQAAPADEHRDRLALAWQVLRERLADRHDLAPLLGRLEAELTRSTSKEVADREELVDLGALAEELLAGLSLERDRRMRFLFRPEGELSMRASRGDLELCLRHLFDLVGQCSSPDSVIRVRVTSTSGPEADPDAPVDATIEFPDAPLADLPMGAELEPETIAHHFGPEVSASLRILRSTASSLGATLTSLPTRPGRRRVRLRLPRMIEATPSSCA